MQSNVKYAQSPSYAAAWFICRHACSIEICVCAFCFVHLVLPILCIPKLWKTSEKASAYLAGCLELRQNIRKATHGQILQPSAYNQKWPTWTKQIALLAHMQCYYSNIQWLPCVRLHGLQYSMLRWPLNPLYVTCLWNRSNCFIVLLFFIRYSFFGENSKEDLPTSLWYSISYFVNKVLKIRSFANVMLNCYCA